MSNGKMSGNRRRWSRVGLLLGKFVADALIIVAGVCVVLLAWPAGPTPTMTSSLSMGTCVSMLVIGIGGRALLSRGARQRMGRERSREPSDDRVQDPTFPDFAIETFKERYPDAEVTKNLIGVLLDPPGYFDRVSERAEIHSSHYQFTTDLGFRSRTEGSALVPVVAVPKGQLMDGLRVSLSGQRVSTLSYAENQGALLTVVETLLDRVAREVEPGGLRSEPAEMRIRILKLVASPAAEPPRGALKDIASLKKHHPDVDDPVLRLLEALVVFCSTSYFILVDVPASKAQTSRITVETQREHLGVRVGPRLAVRLGLGLGVREHSFNLARAHESVSYHFSVLTPKGMYIHENILQNDVLESEDTSAGASGSAASIVRGERKTRAPEIIRGRSIKHAHVYLRDYQAATPAGSGHRIASHPVLRLSLRERPPGLIEISLALSVFLLISTWTVGSFHDTIFAGGATPAGAWPTVLFGIPTVLSGWLIARLDGPTLSRISLSTLAVVAWLVANSMASVLVAAFKSGNIDATEGATSFWFIDVQHPIWAVVMISAAFQFMTSALLAWERFHRYLMTLSRLTDITRSEHP